MTQRYDLPESNRGECHEAHIIGVEPRSIFNYPVAEHSEDHGKNHQTHRHPQSPQSIEQCLHPLLMKARDMGISKNPVPDSQQIKKVNHRVKLGYTIELESCLSYCD